MPSLKARIYNMASGRTLTSGAVPLSWGDLLSYLWRRGGMPRLRGVWRGWRLGACGGRLFIGARVVVQFPRFVRVGRGVSIGHDSYVSGLATDGIRLADNVRIRERAWIQATSVLDEPGVGLIVDRDTYIGPGVILGAGGGIRIGARVMFGANVQLLAENHVTADASRPIQDQGVTRAGITVEDDVWLGNGVIVLDGVTIGRGAVVAAGSVVPRDIPAGAIAIGNPAKVIRLRHEASS